MHFSCFIIDMIFYVMQILKSRPQITKKTCNLFIYINEHTQTKKIASCMFLMDIDFFKIAEFLFSFNLIK